MSMSDSRPQIVWGQVWCNICNEPANFEYTGLHRGFKLGASGMLLINAWHHGDTAEIIVEFSAMRKDPDRRIVAFENAPPPASIEAPAQLSLPEKVETVIDI